MFWILYLVSCFSILLFIFQGFSLALSNESCFSAFSLYLSFSVSMNLGETVTYCGLEWVFLWGHVLMQTSSAQCLSWEGWICCGCQSCLSSGCAGRYHLVREWSWWWRSYSLPKVCRRTSSLLSGHNHPFRGGVCSQVSKIPEGQGQAGTVPFKCVLFLLPILGPLPQRRGILKQVGLCAYRGVMLSLCRWIWLCSDAAHKHVFSLVVANLMLLCGLEWVWLGLGCTDMLVGNPATALPS